jgi:hypothetical protein
MRITGLSSGGVRARVKARERVVFAIRSRGFVGVRVVRMACLCRGRRIVFEGMSSASALNILSSIDLCL